MRSAALLAGSRGFAQALTFASVVIMARVLAADDFGRFVFAQALAAIFIVLVDHGGQFRLVALAARDPRSAPATFGGSWAARNALALLAVPATLLVLALDPRDPLRAGAVAIALAGAAFDAHLLLAFAAFRGTGAFAEEAAWTAAGGALRLALTGAAALGRLALVPWLAALGAGKAVVGLAALARSRGRIRFDWTGNRSAIVPEWRASWPFAVFALTGIAYFQAGTLIVGQLAGVRETGVFQAAFMLFLGAMLVPDAIANVHYPRLARAHAAGDAAFEGATRALAIRLALAGVALAAGLAAAGPVAIGLLFPPGFAAARTWVVWLAPALALRSVSYAFGTALHAAGGQHPRARNNAIALAAMLAGGIGLVPRWGAPGAIAALVASECLLLVLEAAAVRAVTARTAARRVEVGG